MHLHSVGASVGSRTLEDLIDPEGEGTVGRIIAVNAAHWPGRRHPLSHDWLRGCKPLACPLLMRYGGDPSLCGRENEVLARGACATAARICHAMDGLPPTSCRARARSTRWRCARGDGAVPAGGAHVTRRFGRARRHRGAAARAAAGGRGGGRRGHHPRRRRRRRRPHRARQRPRRRRQRQPPRRRRGRRQRRRRRLKRLPRRPAPPPGRPPLRPVAAQGPPRPVRVLLSDG